MAPPRGYRAAGQLRTAQNAAGGAFSPAALAMYKQLGVQRSNELRAGANPIGRVSDQKGALLKAAALMKAKESKDKKTRDFWAATQKQNQAKAKAAAKPKNMSQGGIPGLGQTGGRPDKGKGKSAGGPGKTPRPTPPGVGVPPAAAPPNQGPYSPEAGRFYEAAGQLENLATPPVREVRPGVYGVDFPGTPGDWLERARQLEGIDDPTWQAVKPMYELGSQQEGAENVYQHGYVDVNTGGNEAFGPAQIAKGTFPGWSDPRYQNRYNPVHSYVAMLRGLKNKYGSYAAGGRVISRPGGYG